jgi:hypothetical protein
MLQIQVVLSLAEPVAVNAGRHATLQHGLTEPPWSGQHIGRINNHCWTVSIFLMGSIKPWWTVIVLYTMRNHLHP